MLEDLSQYNWHLINSSMCAFGVLDKYGLVNDIKARVIKLDNGKYFWEASSFLSTPMYSSDLANSLEAAKQAAENFLKGEIHESTE